jgi:hypothetical protein
VWSQALRTSCARRSPNIMPNVVLAEQHRKMAGARHRT